MARFCRGTSPSPVSLHLRLFLIIIAMSMLLAEGVRATEHSQILFKNGRVAVPTNSCSITWGSPAARPTTVFSSPVSPFWMLSSTIDIDTNIEDMDLDETQYEILRMDRLRMAVHWAECLTNDWPELDLRWCLADWHDGKLVPESRVMVGETCWWCEWYGWSIGGRRPDPILTQSRETVNTHNSPRWLTRPQLLKLMIWLYWYIHATLYVPMPDMEGWKIVGQECWKRGWTQGVRKILTREK